jgi:DNA polymerase
MDDLRDRSCLVTGSSTGIGAAAPGRSRPTAPRSPSTTTGAGRQPRRSRPTSAPAEIAACRPWLESEIGVMKPKIVVCLGATAAQALLGKAFKVTRQRGEVVPLAFGPVALATVHPSSILRAPDEAARHAETERFVEDLRRVAARLGG